MLFLLVFSMAGVMLESARILSSDGYVRVAAKSAAMTTFGNYNRELFEEYGLFSYGGYDGIDSSDLNAEFLEILNKNLCASPEGSEESYSDLYRFCEIDSMAEPVKFLTEKKIFHEQIKGFLKRQLVEDVTDHLKEKLDGNTGSAVREKLAIAKDYENGKYNEKEEDQKSGETEEQDSTEGDSAKEDSAKEKEEKNPEKDLKKDAAGGNPLETCSELVGNGILHLVCEEDQIAKEEIQTREISAGTKVSEEETVSMTEKGSAGFLDGLAKEGEKTIDRIIPEKAELLLYATKQFADYTNPLDKTTKYGLEYIAAGKTKENLNLSYVVDRILAIRMLLNMAYVLTDPELQEKSLETATIIAGFTELPPVISAVQYTILFILSFEEACVDVTALLEGREVPVVKERANFKMKYEEICVGTKELFRQKAALYKKGEKGNLTAIGYKQYVAMLILLKGEETIRSRMYDLIQYDLRERFNQTFTVDHCICESTYGIEYRVPFLFSDLPMLSEIGDAKEVAKRRQEVTYAYKSK